MNKSRILVTGANGQLGNSIHALQSNYPQFTFTFTDVEDLDLSSKAAIESYLSENTFDIIINCAAYTAVDKAESDQEMADLINHQAVQALAKVAKKQNLLLIHISTDYVFNGKSHRPYIETDETDPQSIYGLTKLKGEQAFQKVNPNGCVLRTSWVYSEYGNNFVKTMLRLGLERDELGVIFDQVGSPTYAGDLAEVILELVSKPEKVELLEVLSAEDKVFHYSNEGVCSWYDFALMIFELRGVVCKVNPIETKDYSTPATRPHYSLMNKNKIKQSFGLIIPHWKESLKFCLERLKEQS